MAKRKQTRSPRAKKVAATPKPKRVRSPRRVSPAVVRVSPRRSPRRLVAGTALVASPTVLSPLATPIVETAAPMAPVVVQPVAQPQGFWPFWW